MNNNQTKFHKEHNTWKQQLYFYQNEIRFFEDELSNVVAENEDSFSMLEHVEEYKAIFNKKKIHLADLQKAITKHEKTLFESAIEAKEQTHHLAIGLVMEDFVSRFEKLKQNFRRFASHND